MPDRISISTPIQGSPSRISWGSVIAGVVIAIATMFCLTEMVMALGIGFLKPQDASRDAAIPSIALTGALAWVATALVAVFAGGWSAAHLARQAQESVLHGLLVWGLGLVTMLLIATSATGMVIGGAFSLLSSGLSAAGSAAGGLVQATGEVAGRMGPSAGGAAGLPAFRWDAIRFQAQNLMKDTLTAVHPQGGSREPAAGAGPAPAAADAPAAPAPDGDGLALLGRLFGKPGATLSENDRATAVSMLTATTSLSKDAAAKQVQDWEKAAAAASRAYDTMKAEAEQKARAAAAGAAKALADAAWIAFVATLLGASSAMLGAHIGGHRTSRTFSVQQPRQAVTA
jgi:hypothetical protein